MLKKTSNSKLLTPNSHGFTLLEVLVVVGIIGIMFVVATSIFINTIRSANKANITNEARENASLVSETLQKDVHIATDTSINPGPLPPPGTILTLTVPATYFPGGSIVWNCNSGGFITRGGLTITNKDPQNGVNVSTCAFSPPGGSGSNLLVTLDFRMTQGLSAGASQDLQALVQQRVVASPRGYSN